MKYKYIIGIDEAGRGPLAGPVAVGVVMFSKEKYQRFKKENSTPQGLFPRSHLSAPFHSAGEERPYVRGKTFSRTIFKDSKKLTKNKREEWFKKIKENKNIRYIACFTGAGQIDKFGIVNAIRSATNRALEKFEISSSECKVLLDGALKAPSEFTNQKTIIRGDEKELIISLASVVAKVSRDEKMKNFAKKYPKYNFEKHKGYGTKEHYKKIKKHGVCAIHRRSFIKIRP